MTLDFCVDNSCKIKRNIHARVSPTTRITHMDAKVGSDGKYSDYFLFLIIKILVR
jgi:hypothetical protein